MYRTLKCSTFAIMVGVMGFFSSGCATVVNGPAQQLSFSSDPSGAAVEINGLFRGNTPMNTMLMRRNKHNVAFRLDGYETYQTNLIRSLNGMTLGNFLLLPVWFIGFGVDAVSGAMFRQRPEAVHAVLNPGESGAPEQTVTKQPAPTPVPAPKSRAIIDLDGLNAFLGYTGTTGQRVESSAPVSALDVPLKFNPEMADTHPHKNATIAVLKFDAASTVTDIDPVMLSDRFSIELSKVGVYRVVSQSKMKEILEMQNYSADCTTMSCAVEAGQLLGVQYMAYGSIGRVGLMYSINVQVVDVESGAVVAVSTVDHEGRLEDLVSKAMSRAVDSLMISISPDAID